MVQIFPFYEDVGFGLIMVGSRMSEVIFVSESVQFFGAEGFPFSVKMS